MMLVVLQDLGLYHAAGVGFSPFVSRGRKFVQSAAYMSGAVLATFLQFSGRELSLDLPCLKERHLSSNFKLVLQEPCRRL